MKTYKILAATAIVLATMAGCNSQKKATSTGNIGKDAVVNPNTLLPRKGEIDSVSYLIGIQFGSFIKGYNFGDKLNYSQIKKGILDFINAKGNYRDSDFVKQFKINPEKMNDLVNSFLEKRAHYVQAVNTKKENDFLEANKAKDNVKVSESGLQYTILNAGDTTKIGDQDTVYVHYKGTLLDGTVFDEVPAKRASARLVLNRVIKGWKEGIQLVGVNGKVKLFVPSKLGYGEQGGANGIEPNSTLLFDVQVDSVRHFVAPVEKPVKNKR
ncbi:MAG: FKBP-type peptidyl-prolyl cis-trans isomerase [Bacteroidales bacterium]|jgi:FKBP-type peptidyl-prolyl cis-trans isomerase|nr:FKBP-type peptidyl-prolyl cis-trans isomerase [Bacteroidales bacterium]MCI1784607.1 FKBP-type peptidyl-prolyl cis-trans isomerase [Bacteroidales bacterium]